jgi:glycosyltransferase involved in cell wall biosynthesis
LIIIDDGSTDKSNEIIQSINDDRIVHHKLEKNMGIATATNLGHDLAKGKYIAHMDQDDIALPNRLKRQASLLERLPHVDVLGGRMEVFGSTSYVAGAPVTDGEIKANLLFGTANIYNPTAMIRHSFLKEKNLKFNPALKLPNWEFYVQAMFRGARFANVSETVLHYRGHENNETQDLSRFRNEFIPVRLSVLELFYPELTWEERVTVEPLLQFMPPPNLPIAQVESSLEIINKMLEYKKQSTARENRKTLQTFLERRKEVVQRTLESYHQLDKLPSS